MHTELSGRSPHGVSSVNPHGDDKAVHQVIPTSAAETSIPAAYPLADALTAFADDPFDSLPTKSPKETALLLYTWRTAPVLVRSDCVRTKNMVVKVRKQQIMDIVKRSDDECSAIGMLNSPSPLCSRQTDRKFNLAGFIASTTTGALDWARGYASSSLNSTLGALRDSPERISLEASFIILSVGLKNTINLNEQNKTALIIALLASAIATHWSSFISKPACMSIAPLLNSYHFYVRGFPRALEPSTTYPFDLHLALHRILSSWRSFLDADTINSPVFGIVTFLVCLRSLSSQAALPREQGGGLSERAARELLALHCKICCSFDAALDTTQHPPLRCVLYALRITHHMILIPYLDPMVAMRVCDLANEVRLAESWLCRDYDPSVTMWMCAVGGSCIELSEGDDGDGDETSAANQEDRATFRSVFAQASERAGVKGQVAMDVLEKIGVPRSMHQRVREFTGRERPEKP